MIRRPVFLLLAVASAGWLRFAASTALPAETNYPARGVLKEVRADARQLVIAHEAIPGFMEAMTMPFNVKDTALLTNSSFAPGAKLSFQLHVTEVESWIDSLQIIKPGNGVKDRRKGERPDGANPKPVNPLRDYKFTNELGQPVSLSDFKGQAVAITFFFTRCPIPEYCPRLSRNFAEVQRKLALVPNAPTNWHLLAVTFDPERDTPAVLKSYGETYKYDAAHWSFLTGPRDKITELARQCDVQFDADNGFFNHNFRTLIIDASNRLQIVFPTSGDLSDAIVQELLKAANPSGTNSLAVSPTKR